MLREARHAVSRSVGRTTAGWRARDALRTLGYLIIREPLAGVVGWGFLITGCLLEAAGIACPRPVLVHSLLCTEAIALTAGCAPLIIASTIVKWRRR